MDIRGIDKATLLAALVNGSKPQGMGHLTNRGHFRREQAQQLIDKRTERGEKLYFDYVNGCPIKCDIGGDVLDTRKYNRDAGEGIAEAIVEAIRKRGGNVEMFEVSSSPVAMMVAMYLKWRAAKIRKLVAEIASELPVIIEDEAGKETELTDEQAYYFREGMKYVVGELGNSPLDAGEIRPEPKPEATH
ncbi:MAG: hypothetical protein CMJ75_19030 [Planctomycetaceae bacterium]|nr:hypothetical protein [Planctomycetaceae bacterium]